MKINRQYHRIHRITVTALCAVLMAAVPETAWAGSSQLKDMDLSAGRYIAVAEKNADIYVSMDSYDILKTAAQGEEFQILDDAGGGWMEVKVEDGVGYLSAEDADIQKEESGDDQKTEEAQGQQAGGDASGSLRRYIVDFARQFLGCAYRYGGNDPHSGVDCSGFVRYVLQNAAGVALQRSSRAQASQGRAVSADQMRPGDLIFYAKGSGINHVGIYAGDGQVIHASTYKTGVKMSPWNYRTPVRIVNMLGD